VFQGVNTANMIGTPIDPLAVVEAENTVAVLSAAKCMLFFLLVHVHNLQLTYHIVNLPVITDPVIETAKNRAYMLRGARESISCSFLF
jgi:hypothetical protein